MHPRSTLLAALALPATLFTAIPARAEPPNLLARCWPIDALAVRDGERKPMRGATGHAVTLPRLPPAAAPITLSPVRGAIRRVELPKGQKLVALTLDLCEQPGEIAGYDGPVFDILRHHRIKATVFAGGKWLMTHAERGEQLLADPMLEIGTHGWAHRNVRVLTSAALRDELQGPLASFAVRRQGLAKRQCAVDAPELLRTIPIRPHLYRFPFGACHAAALDTVASLGLTAIQWDVSTGDSTPSQSPQSIAATIIAHTRPGSIVLAHANGRGQNTAAALAIAIPKLKERGYQFVTVSELLAAGKPVVSPTCYDARPGDTDKYDALFVTPRPAAATRSPVPVPRKEGRL